MANEPVHVVTGAFGYSGRRIAKLLIDRGYRVRTLTNSKNKPNPFEGKIEVYPLNFDSVDSLAESLEGTEVLYNTYWVRFKRKGVTHEIAVQNTFRLFEAAKKANVRRIVHISITNPSLDSPFEYFRGKARIEKALIDSGISYTILRPAILYGDNDILINNIAWTLRRLPVFGVFGDGKYKIQPIFVGDLAELAVESGSKNQNEIINAIGPETFIYRDLVKMIGEAIGCKRPIIGVPLLIGYIAARLTGMMMGDIMLTWDEARALTMNLLYVNAPPAGKTKLSEWVKENANTLGLKYASELAKRK